MNGTRSIFLRKGYWLTALAAIVLLAASPGTAQAQIEVTGPDEVTEGETATYTVAIKGFIKSDNQGYRSHNGYRDLGPAFARQRSYDYHG